MTNEETRDPTLPEQEIIETQPVPPSPPPLALQAVKLTDVGRVRTHNEDYVDFYVPPDPRQLERKGSIYLVADGMGGHQAGEVASQGAVELVIGQYYSDTTHDIGTSLVRAFRAANQLIYEQAQADASKAGMGTTLTAAVILGRKVYLANVGDSRAYLINAAGITQITEDHSWVEEQVRAGLLTPEQATQHPQRNLLTRALGTKPNVDVDLFEGELGEGDMLFLCSDGLTGRVEDREIAAILKEHPPEEAAQFLVGLANERGGNDNITVLIVSDREATPTVAAPMAVPAPPPASVPAPIQKKPTRKFPLIPILAVVATVLILALGGLLLVPLLSREPTATPTTPAVAPTATLLPTIEATQPGDVTQAPVETNTAAVGETPGEPTATLAATFTPSPSTPTSERPQPQPSDTPRSPANTPQPSDPAPTLTDPPSEADLRGEMTFRWDYPSMPLGLGKAFQILIWKEGDTAHNGAAEFTRWRTQRLNLDEVPQIKTSGPGEYYWTVVVVNKRTEQRISPEAEPRRFTYTGPQPDREKPTKAPTAERVTPSP
jgi:serine/threonine protein phosphatase PrpC